MIVGEGKYRYEFVDGWEQLPSGWSHGDVAGVATDSQDSVYVFNRGEHPVIIYDSDGKFLDSWGDKTTYPRPHGITIVDDIVYLVDDADHTVRKCTLDGKILMTLGTSGKPSDTGYRAERARQPDHHRAGGRPVQSPDPPLGRARTATSTWRTATATPASIASRPDGTLRAVLGRARARPRPVQPAALGLGARQRRDLGLLTARTTASRSSARPASCSGCGPTSPAPATCSSTPDGTVIIGEMCLGEGRDKPGGPGLAREPRRQADHPRRRRQRARRLGRGRPVRPWRLLVAARPLGGLEGQHLRGEVTHTALSRYNRWHESCHSIVKYARV